MLDFSRVETDAIRAGVPRCRRGLPGDVVCRRLVGTVRAEQHCGIDWPAGHDDLRSARRPHPSCLRVATPCCTAPAADPRASPEASERGHRPRPPFARTKLGGIPTGPLIFSQGLYFFVTMHELQMLIECTLQNLRIPVGAGLMDSAERQTLVMLDFELRIRTCGAFCLQGDSWSRPWDSLQPFGDSEGRFLSPHAVQPSIPGSVRTIENRSPTRRAPNPGSCRSHD